MDVAKAQEHDSDDVRSLFLPWGCVVAMAGGSESITSPSEQFCVVHTEPWQGHELMHPAGGWTCFGCFKGSKTSFL